VAYRPNAQALGASELVTDLEDLRHHARIAATRHRLCVNTISHRHRSLPPRHGSRQRRKRSVCWQNFDISGLRIQRNPPPALRPTVDEVGFTAND